MQWCCQAEKDQGYIPLGSLLAAGLEQMLQLDLEWTILTMSQRVLIALLCARAAITVSPQVSRVDQQLSNSCRDITCSIMSLVRRADALHKLCAR